MKQRAFHLSGRRFLKKGRKFIKHQSAVVFGWLLLSLLATASTTAQAATLVVPAGLENTPGNTFADPFFSTVGPSVTQAYSASDFSGISADTISIFGLAFRLDENERGSLEVTIPQVLLTMGISKDPLADLNHLPNSVVVFDHPVQLSVRNGAGPAFDIFFTLDRPFLYNRTLGDLVLQFNSHQTFGVIAGVDAQFGAEGELYYYEIGGALRSVPETILTQFTYSAIPEPSTLSLLLVVGTVLLIPVAWQRI